MVMAGGTGGHVYPAIAVADYLKLKGWNIVWLATELGMENRLIEGKILFFCAYLFFIVNEQLHGIASEKYIKGYKNSKEMI